MLAAMRTNIRMDVQTEKLKLMSLRIHGCRYENTAVAVKNVLETSLGIR